jgi:HicB family
MDLLPYITSLREDLTATASAGDEQTRRTAAVLSAALEPAMRLALMNALADLAAEITTALPEHVVEVRLDGRDVRVVVTATPGSPQERTAPPPPQPSPPMAEGGENIARMTLRMVEQIKGQAEQAAAAQGVSLNTFISQAVQGALYGRSSARDDDTAEPRPGKNTDSHLHGWVKG